MFFFVVFSQEKHFQLMWFFSKNFFETFFDFFFNTSGADAIKLTLYAANALSK